MIKGMRDTRCWRDRGCLSFAQCYVSTTWSTSQWPSHFTNMVYNTKIRNLCSELWIAFPQNIFPTANQAAPASPVNLLLAYRKAGSLQDEVYTWAAFNHSFLFSSSKKMKAVTIPPTLLLPWDILGWLLSASLWCLGILDSAGIKLTLFLVASAVLCFGFYVRKRLITPWSFTCC